MNRLNQTESAVFKHWMLYLQRIFQNTDCQLCVISLVSASQNFLNAFVGGGGVLKYENGIYVPYRV